jgi:toxin ParE1/3/4
MSSPNRYTLRLSRQAEADLESILQYTYETYGEQQMYIYSTALHEALEAIADNPGIGHGRPDLSERHRAFRVEHHFVVYTVSGQTVNVSRILYERMDFTRHIRH